VEVRGLANVLQDLWLGPDSERQLRDKRRGDKGGETKDNPTDASHRGRQLNRKS
jgi:hypothetical protein